MDLIAKTVNWTLARDLQEKGQLGRRLSAGFEEVFIEDIPSPSESASHHRAVAEAYMMIRTHLCEPTLSSADSVMGTLINEDYLFPHDLGADVDPELLAGALAPDRVRDLLKDFSEIADSELRAAAKKVLEERDELRNLEEFAEMDSYGEDDIDTDGLDDFDLDDPPVPDYVAEVLEPPESFIVYLRRWESFLKAAKDRDAGVFLHMG